MLVNISFEEVATLGVAIMTVLRQKSLNQGIDVYRYV